MCQPEAQRLPNTLFFAASSSTWKGCGSYLRANALIASASNVCEPSVMVSPMRKNSSRLMRRPRRGQEHDGVFEFEDAFAALVEQLAAQRDEAELGLRFRQALGQHGGPAGQRIAGQHRLLPFDLVDAGRALRGRVEQEGVAQHAHEHRAGVPAGGRQPAKDAGLAGFLVEMHRLRIEFAGEFDDLGRAHLLGAEVDRRALDEILIGPVFAGHDPEIRFSLNDHRASGCRPGRRSGHSYCLLGLQSQPRRRKYQNGRIADRIIRPMAKG